MCVCVCVYTYIHTYIHAHTHIGYCIKKWITKKKDNCIFLPGHYPFILRTFLLTLKQGKHLLKKKHLQLNTVHCALFLQIFTVYLNFFEGFQGWYRGHLLCQRVLLMGDYTFERGHTIISVKTRQQCFIPSLVRCCQKCKPCNHLKTEETHLTFFFAIVPLCRG